MLEKLPSILFVLGLLLESVGFLLGAVDNIPVVLRIVSPRYVTASHALEILASDRVINASVPGFEDIAGIFLNAARSQNSPEAMRTIEVQELRLKGTTGLAFGKAAVRETVPVVVALSNGQEVDWDLVTIRKQIEDLKGHQLFGWAIGLFVAGIISQVVGFIVDKYWSTPA